MPGAPFIYYGDEIGMRYVEGLKSVEADTTAPVPVLRCSGMTAPTQDSPAHRPVTSTSPWTRAKTVRPPKHRWPIRIPCTTKLKTHPDPPEQQSTLKPRNHRVRLCRENQYPLAYVREAEGEKVLVIINPSDKEQSFPYSAELKDALYTIGGKAESKDGTITIPAQSAGFYHI